MSESTTEQSSREQEREALRDARYFVELYARRNPRFEHAGEMQDPSGVNACLERIDAVLARPTMLLQDENSGREGRRYNEWHASRPDARLNAREAAASIHPTPITAEEAGREGDGWLPIETAPKDRRILLGYAPDADHEDGYVAEGRWWEGYDDAPDDMGSDGGFMDSEFQFFRCPRSFGAEQYRTKGLQPTHWQLLPPAPAQSGKDL